MKKLLLLTSLSILLVAFTGMAFGTPVQLSLGGSAMGSGFGFVNQGGTTYIKPTAGSSSTTACGANQNCAHGFGTLDNGNMPPPQVTYAISQLPTTPPISGSPFLTNPQNLGDTYDINMNGATWTMDVCMVVGGCGAGELIGTITVTTLNNALGMGGNVPQVLGSFMASSATGGFAPYWPIGGSSGTDFDIALSPGRATVNYVYNHPGTATSGRISSGEVLQGVPEPGTLALMGTGILGLAGYIRRKTS